MNTHHTYQKPSVVKPESKLTPSLATEMQVRAASAERVRAHLLLIVVEADGPLEFQAQKVKAALEADDQRQQEEERASRLAYEMKRDTQRREQKIRADQERKQAMERFLVRSEQDDSIVKFDGGNVQLEDGRTFNAVKILMPHACTFKILAFKTGFDEKLLGLLGKISAVEPILDTPIPSSKATELDLHSFYFTSTYYSRSQGMCGWRLLCCLAVQSRRRTL